MTNPASERPARGRAPRARPVPVDLGASPPGVADAMRRAALAVSTVEGDGVFRELIRSLATILGTDLAFIALPVPDDPTKLRMLAFFIDGRIVEDFVYPLTGTPCETVMGQQYRAYPAGLRELFPLDTDFARLGLEAYAGHPLFDAHGGPLGLIAVVARRPLPDAALVESMLKIFAARAVTEIERARADHALRTAEASYRAIFEAAEDAIFVHDWDTGAVLDANARACAAYGYTRDELVHITLDLISSNVPPYTPQDAARWIEVAKRDGYARFEWHRRSKDGSLHWDEVRLKAAVIGGQRRVVAFSREITQRKLAEDALRASEEQYRAIFAASVDGMTLVDTAGRIVDANPAFTGICGYPRVELLGRTLDVLRPSADGPSCATLLGELTDGLMAHGECQARRSDGTLVDVEVRGVPMHYAGQPHVLAIVRDITDRKRAEDERERLEAQLRQAQRMEAIGQLTGGIAHDFNNILTSVLGYTVLAQERVGEAGDPALLRYLGQTQRASQRARDLIQQMLTFSRGRRGEARPLALASQLRESLTLLRSTLPATIELETDLQAGVPQVLADPVQCEQVLLNLCINARDAIAATGSGTGTIRATLRYAMPATLACASCRQPVRGPFVEIAVADTGSGIPADVIDRMFEPFFTTKEVGKGSGMGLAMVHGIVHEHGGHIVVESSPGRGSTFRVLLPALSGDSRTEAAEPAGTSSAGGRRRRLVGRILVVDDEPMVADYLGELLAGYGLAVTVKLHPDDAEAWYAADPERVDLVITDQTMPRRTGIELARRLTLQRPELPVLLHTGYGEDLAPDVLARSGVTALLRKPVDPGEMLALVERHLPPPRDR